MSDSKRTVFAAAVACLAAAITLIALIPACKPSEPSAPVAPAPQTTANQSPAAEVNPPAPQFIEITLTRKEFTPGVVTVPLRSTVTWVNRSDEMHSVISTDKLFSVPIPIGGSFSYTFNQSGTFSYYCKVWPEMAGTVYVK